MPVARRCYICRQYGASAGSDEQLQDSPCAWTSRRMTIKLATLASYDRRLRALGSGENKRRLQYVHDIFKAVAEGRKLHVDGPERIVTPIDHVCPKKLPELQFDDRLSKYKKLRPVENTILVTPKSSDVGAALARLGTPALGRSSAEGRSEPRRHVEWCSFWRHDLEPEKIANMCQRKKRRLVDLPPLCRYYTCQHCGACNKTFAQAQGTSAFGLRGACRSGELWLMPARTACRGSVEET